jgi:hypothetical protein
MAAQGGALPVNRRTVTELEAEPAKRTAERDEALAEHTCGASRRKRGYARRASATCCPMMSSYTSLHGWLGTNSPPQAMFGLVRGKRVHV